MTIALRPYQAELIEQIRGQTCRCCGVEKPLHDFHFRKDTGKHCATCKQCVYAKNKQWAANNPDARKTIANRYARANRDKSKTWKRANPEKAKQWERQNPERNRELKRQWARQNPHKVLADVRKRQAQKLRATPSWANLDAIEKIYEQARQQGMEVDHIYPLRSRYVCGLHCEGNLRIVSREENRRKGNRMPEGYP
jgi:hypothetical protein